MKQTKSLKRRTRKITGYITPELRKLLYEHCVARQITFTDVINEALKMYLMEKKR